MLQFLEQFSGLFGLLFFVSTIFKYSGSSLSPNASSIIVGIIQLVGCYCSTLLVDRAGRKILIGTSSFGISLGMFVFAAYSFMDKLGYDLSLFKWVPLASFSFTLFIANLGVLTLPFLVTSELIITLPKVWNDFEGREFVFAFKNWNSKQSQPQINHLYNVFFLDQRFYLHFLPLSLLGFRFHHPQILWITRSNDRNEWLDADIFNQLSHWRTFCHHFCARNEGKKFSRNLENARMRKK